MADEFDLADKALGGTKKSLWEGLDSGQQTAWLVLTGAAAFSVLGVPIISLVTGGGAVPGLKHFAAAGWLVVITLPVAAAACVGVYCLAAPLKAHPVVVLGLCAISAVGGVAAMTAILGESAGNGLAGFYCYNSGEVVSEQCRSFNDLGFYAAAQLGSASQNVGVIQKAVLFTADARGWVIVFCGILAGGSIGYLVRRGNPS